MCEVAALLAEAMELLFQDADPRACQLRMRYEQLVLKNDVSSVDTGDEVDRVEVERKFSHQKKQQTE